ncbi:hypothetical protein Scep_004197 [Stephania cephalantha]|uniref:Uncharacterized protein n=1 Tax=Stephania cephalantha TaxID=152367 RepID=A0AAP0KTH0_9MAGN
MIRESLNDAKPVNFIFRHGASLSASHHDTPSPPVHALPAQHGTIPSSLHPSSVAAWKMSLVFKSGYLKEGWKWEYVPQSQRDIYWLRWKVFFTWDLQMSFAIYEAWCQKAAIRYTGNIYRIAKKRITPIYLTMEVFVHYKRMRATDEAFKKKSEQKSTNRKSEVGGSGTGISLHSAGSISARQHGDMLAPRASDTADSTITAFRAFGPRVTTSTGHLRTDITPSHLRTRMTTSLDIGPIHIEGCLRINVIFWMIMMSLCRNLCRLRDHRHGNSDWMFYLFLCVYV